MLSRELAREEMFAKLKNEIPQNLLIVIKNNNAIVWEEKNEFEYKGEMFDVVKISISKTGETLYHCVNDTKESEIINHLEKMTRKNSDEKKSIQKINIDYCFVSDPNKREVYLQTDKEKKNNFSYTHHYIFNLNIGISKPPQLV